MNIKLILVLFFIPLAAFAKKELKIFTYGSFNSDWGPGPNIEKEFEAICDCDLIWNTSDSSGALLSRIKLTNNKEEYDIVLGLDDSLLDEAKKSNLFIKHKIKVKGLDIFWDDDYFTPFDFGYFSFIYDENKLKNPPKSFKELSKRKDLSIIIMDPRFSTPGLGLAKWINQIYGENSLNFWNQIEDQIVITAKSWSDGYGLFLEGESDMVLSYSTSPAYHSLIEGNTQYKSMIFEEGHARQIEVMGILKNTTNVELARSFMEFSLLEGFQRHIPQGNWMYPVLNLKNSEKDFYNSSPMPKSLDQIFPSLDQKNRWIEDWERSISD